MYTDSLKKGSFTLGGKYKNMDSHEKVTSVAVTDL